MWEDFYAELKNKIRWSIASTTAGAFNLSYQASNQLAGKVASELLAVFKAKEQSPDLDTVAYFVKLYENGSKPLDKPVAKP